MCGLRKKFALSTISHLQFEGRKCAVPLLSHLQHKKKVVQYGRKCAVPELLHQQYQHRVCDVEKVSIIKNVTSAVPGEKMFCIRRVASTVQGEACAV